MSILFLVSFMVFGGKMHKSIVSSKINESTFKNIIQFLSDEKGNERIKMDIGIDVMKVLDESSQINLKFCISREMLYRKLKSVK